MLGEKVITTSFYPIFNTHIKLVLVRENLVNKFDSKQ